MVDHDDDVISGTLLDLVTPFMHTSLHINKVQRIDQNMAKDTATCSYYYFWDTFLHSETLHNSIYRIWICLILNLRVRIFELKSSSLNL